MNKEELKVLLEAASAAQLDPASLKPVNPWSQKGPKAETLQMSVQENFPQMAAQWRVEAGESLSLAAVAAKQGITEISPNVQKELNSLDRDTIVGQQEAAARLEASTLAGMAQAADDLAAKRESQQKAFAAQAGSNSSSGQHNREFLRRMGVTNAAQLNRIPARRVVGK